MAENLEARGAEFARRIDAMKGGSVRGASTITQQVVKNFLLSADRQAERKIKEIILATRLEETLDKERILELYLNEIFLGQNSFGVTAAAQAYFNKTLSELAPHEAATLASMPKAPGRFHPVRNKERVLQRRNFVLKEMFENGYISEAVYKSERELPLRSVQNGDFEPFKDGLPPRDYFTDEIRRQLSNDFGEEEFFTGGMTVRATIDPEMQQVAAAALQRQLEQFDRGVGRWRGTGKSISAENLGTEADWREALAGTNVPRDINLESHWFPAVVLEIADQSMRIGIEGITPERCHAALKDAWATANQNLILTTKAESKDTRQRLTEAYHASQAIAVEPPVEVEDQDFAYTDFGPAGSVQHETHIKDLDFMQLELCNHVRVNLKQTDFQKNAILLTARFGYGTLTQPRDQPGLPMLASALLNGGGLSAHSNDELSRILAGRNVGASFGIQEDAFSLSGSTTPDDLELQLQLMCAKLTAPGYRDEALRQFQKQIPAFASQLKYTLGGAGADMQAWLHGGDGRFAKPDPEQLMTDTADDVKAWVAEDMQHAAIELSIVGDFDPQTATPLILKTFGALPERSQTIPPLTEARQIEQPTLPADKTFHYESKIDKAVAMVSWRGAPIKEDIRESRRMNVLASILKDRLRKKLREELGSTYSPSASFSASREFNTAYLSATSVATSAETKVLQTHMLEIASDIATEGATTDELDRALKPILGELPMHWRQNNHWLHTVLSQSQTKPFTLEWARERDADYESITLEEVNALAKHTLTENAARITLMPKLNE